MAVLWGLSRGRTVCLCTTNGNFDENATLWAPNAVEDVKKEEQHLKRNVLIVLYNIALLAMANCFAMYIA